MFISKKNRKIKTWNTYNTKIANRNNWQKRVKPSVRWSPLWQGQPSCWWWWWWWMCLYDRSKDQGLAAAEWLASPSVVSNNCLSVFCLSRTEVDAQSTCVLAADFDGHLQHGLCLPLNLHVYWGNCVEFLPVISTNTDTAHSTTTTTVSTNTVTDDYYYYYNYYKYYY